METCETVRVVGDAPDGYVVINKEDFDPTSQVLFVEPQDEQPILHMAPPEAEAAMRAEHAASVDGFLDSVKNKKRRMRRVNESEASPQEYQDGPMLGEAGRGA